MRAQGFTLLEMLIATTLLAVVLSLGNMAFGLFSTRWADREDAFTARFEATRRVLLVQDVIESLFPYVVHDPEGAARIYFEGNVNGFVAVAAQGLYQNDTECVVRLRLEQSADLSFRLLYEEWPLSGVELENSKQPIPFGEPLEIAKGLRGAKFDYFGWPTEAAKLASADRRLNEQKARPQWLSRYNSLSSDLMPRQIRLSLGENLGYLLFNPAIGDSRLLARHQEG